MILRRAILLSLMLLGVMAEAAVAHSVVLVVPPDSAVVDLDSVSIRKLFLGVPVLINGHPLHPIRNRSDAQLDLIFLQEIAAMSQSAYDRQTLIGINRQGWLRPEEIDSTPLILQRLYTDPYAVTFVWDREVARNPRLKVIRVIWSD